MKRFAIVAVAVAMLAVGVGFGTRGADAAASPVANAGGPYAAAPGQAIQFNGGNSSGFGLVSFYWNFGDGTAASGVNPVKAYAAPGVYTVTLTVQDTNGFTSSATTTASISGFVPNTLPSDCVRTTYGFVNCTLVGNTLVTTANPFGCVLTVFGYVCNRSTVVSVPAVVGAAVIDQAIPRSTSDPRLICVGFGSNPHYVNGILYC